ncbi:protein ABHD13 [Octopus sinensis]|nr:protein ABHD13 [Octopus sinensis]
MNAYGLYTSLGCNVLMVEYRGYGKSQGSPSEMGLYQDAEVAMDFLLRHSQISRDKIVVFGRSLGGAVAIYLASHPYYSQHIHSVFIENTFTSLPEIGAVVIGIPIIGLLPYWCFKNQFPSIKRVPKITVPVMYLSGLTDNLIPPRMMKMLFESTVNSPLKRMALFDNGTHNETWLCPGYYECILNFIAEVSKWRSTSALTNYSDVLTKIV